MAGILNGALAPKGNDMEYWWLTVKWMEVPEIDWYGPFDSKEQVLEEYRKLDEDSGAFIEWSEASCHPTSFDPYEDE